MIPSSMQVNTKCTFHIVYSLYGKGKLIPDTSTFNAIVQQMQAKRCRKTNPNLKTNELLKENTSTTREHTKKN